MGDSWITAQISPGEVSRIRILIGKGGLGQREEIPETFALLWNKGLSKNSWTEPDFVPHYLWLAE